jgi:beta-glucosidase
MRSKNWNENLHRDDFGRDFSWGVSVAATQIEGAAATDGKGPSIWDVFSAKRGKIFQNHSPETACNFYNQHSQDFAIMHHLGIRNFRFSISWPRILPLGIGKINHKGLDFYKRLIDQLLSYGIEPWPTLYHWDLPQALENRGGWTNREILGWFETYSVTVASHLGNRGIKNWMVLNEPLVFTGAGYFLGYHAPGRRGFSNFIPAMLHAALCTRIGEGVLRTHESDIRIGSTYSCSLIHPQSQSLADQVSAKKADALLNRLFIEPAMGLGFPVDVLKVLRPVEKFMKKEDEANLKANLDFIGVQNYTREVVTSAWYVPYLKARLVNAKKRGVAHTEMQWEIYPEALYEMLAKFSAYNLKIPLIVTENGAAFPDQWRGEPVIADPQRTDYLIRHLGQVKRAKDSGILVDGYFVWTLMDNFEWAEGYRPPIRTYICGF